MKECVKTQLGGGAVVRYSCAFEERLLKLKSEGKLKKYLKANPQHRTAKDHFAATLQKSMNLIRFYEIGSFEKVVEKNTSKCVRAFYCRNNLGATDVAATVHADYGRYFSFVQVVTYGDLFELKGDLTDLKTEGKIRPQGTKYTVGDGDIIDFELCNLEYRLKFAKKKKGL
jgi:ribosome-binding ATPase YchF (GTP1/OBG family)